MLLRLERPHLDRKLRRRDRVGDEHEPPARAAAPGRTRSRSSVSVSCCQPPGVVDARAPPDPRGAVEVEEASRAVARRVLDDEVAVEQDRLSARQKGAVAVQVPPARLHHADFGVGEVVDQARARSSGRGRSRRRIRRRTRPSARSSPEARAPALYPARSLRRRWSIATPRARSARDRVGHDGRRLVGRIVEDLDVEPVARPVDARRPPRSRAGRRDISL